MGWITGLCVCVCVCLSVLPQNPGIPPIDIVRDPRIGRLWTKYKETDLPVPKFKVPEAEQHTSCGTEVLSEVADTPPSLCHLLGCGVNVCFSRVVDFRHAFISGLYRLIQQIHATLLLHCYFLISAVSSGSTWCNINPTALLINSCRSRPRSMTVTSAPYPQRR